MLNKLIIEQKGISFNQCSDKYTLMKIPAKITTFLTAC